MVQKNKNSPNVQVNAYQQALKHMKSLYSAPMVKSISQAMQGANLVSHQLEANKAFLQNVRTVSKINAKALKSVSDLSSANAAALKIQSISNNPSIRAVVAQQNFISKQFTRLPPMQEIKSSLDTPVNKLLNQQAKLMSQYTTLAKSKKIFDTPLMKSTAYSSTLNAASNMAKLTKTMSPFLQSQQVDIASQTNKILQEINKNPVKSFLKFVERPNNSSKTEDQTTNDAFRENSQSRQKSDNTGTSETYIDNSINITINNYQNSIDEDARKHPDVQISLEYFQYLFNFIYLIFLIVGVDSGTEKAMEIISIALELIIQTLDFKSKN